MDYMKIRDKDAILNQLPKGTLITLNTTPKLLPTVPLKDRKWIQFKNEDLVDVEICNAVGNVFETLEPGIKSDKYVADDEILFYGKVASGTADTGVRAIEGK